VSQQHTLSQAATAHAPEAWRGTVFLLERHSLYLGAAAETSLHASHEVKVCVALRGSFRLRTGHDARWLTCQAAIIPPGQLHQLDGRGAQLSLFYFPPEIHRAQRVVYSGRPAHPVPPELLARFAPRLRRYLDDGCDTGEAAEICLSFTDELIAATGSRVFLDGRIAETLASFQAAPDHLFTAAQISAAVALSPGRLAHLFRAQIGMPVREYLLYRRLRRAVLRMAGADSLTQAAHEAGFADSSHLSRTFRRTVGLAPSSLTRNSRFFRVGT